MFRSIRFSCRVVLLLASLVPLGCASSTAPTGAEQPTSTSPPPSEPVARTAPSDPPPPNDEPGERPRGHDAHGHHAHGHHARGAAGYDMDFSATERFAAHFDDPERDAWQKPAEVVRLLELAPGQIVADLGAGTGYFEPHLARAVGRDGRVVALDAEPKMVSHLERRGSAEGWTNVEARRVPYDDPGLLADSVDRVLIVNTWHHISSRRAYARKLLSALRPGGAVLVVDFTAGSDMGPPPRHRLPPERVVAELEAGGLTATLVEESLPKQYVVRGARP